MKSYEEIKQINEESIKEERASIESLQEAKEKHCDHVSHVPCSSDLTGSSYLGVSAIIDCKKFKQEDSSRS